MRVWSVRMWPVRVWAVRVWVMRVVGDGEGLACLIHSESFLKNAFPSGQEARRRNVYTAGMKRNKAELCASC